jgi:two-component system OmpR family response regulator
MKRLLVVDDDYDLVMALKRHLAKKYEVTIALGGGAALLKLRKEHFDLVLLDFLMPSVDGAGVIERFRDMGLDTPVILMSAVPAVMQAQTIGLRVAGRLAKPFDLEELEARIDAVVGRDAP